MRPNKITRNGKALYPITVWLQRDDVSHTSAGTISNEVWLETEADRIRRSGKEVDIFFNGDEAALFVEKFKFQAL